MVNTVICMGIILKFGGVSGAFLEVGTPQFKYTSFIVSTNDFTRQISLGVKDASSKSRYGGN